MRPRFVDLSHPIESGSPGYPGLPVPRVEPWRSHAASRPDYGGQAEFEITRLFLVGNTGTHLDSPRHRFPGAPDIADLPLERLAALPGRCLDADGRLGIDARLADGDHAGTAVLVRSGWDRHRGTDAYWRGAPFLARALAERLVAAGVALVGIDGPNIDDVADASRPAHTLLLGAGIPVVEHLRGLGGLPASGFRFFAVPAPVRTAAAMPVRAFAIVDRPGEDGGF